MIPEILIFYKAVELFDKFFCNDNLSAVRNVNLRVDLVYNLLTNILKILVTTYRYTKLNWIGTKFVASGWPGDDEKKVQR